MFGVLPYFTRHIATSLILLETVASRNGSADTFVVVTIHPAAELADVPVAVRCPAFPRRAHSC
jgi:hypothetical protein